MITQEKLKELINYDPETGVFTWLPRNISAFKTESDAKRWNTRYSNKTAGCKGVKGYLFIRFNKRHVRSHRLAWLYVHGSMPENEIDHINGIRTDNRLCNLRDVTSSENKQNLRKALSNNSTGFLGVTSMGKSGGFRAVIKLNGKVKHLGCFSNPEEAHQAYLTAKRALHSHCTI